MAWRRIGDKRVSEPILTQIINAYMRHSVGVGVCVCVCGVGGGGGGGGGVHLNPQHIVDNDSEDELMISVAD